MEFENVLLTRRSTRDYYSDPVEEADIEKLLLAAQSSPLPPGYGDKTLLSVVSGELVDKFRESMAFKRKDGSSIDPFYGAGLVIFLSITEKSKDYIEYSNVGCIIENMLLQATALGLGSTYIWGSLRKLRGNPETLALLDLPEGFEVISAAAFGRPKEPLSIRDITPKFQVRRL